MTFHLELFKIRHDRKRQTSANSKQHTNSFLLALTVFRRCALTTMTIERQVLYRNKRRQGRRHVLNFNGSGSLLKILGDKEPGVKIMGVPSTPLNPLCRRPWATNDAK